jgi:hypothetical protein
MTPYDHAPPVSPSGGEPGSAAAHPAPLDARSGSQKRKRNRKVDTRWDDAEHAALLEKSTAAGLSPNAYIRAVVLGTSGPRARRAPTVHAQLLGHGIAELNRAGNVANQIAHHLNAGGAIGLGRECAATLAEIREAARAIREAAGRKERDDHQGEQA